MLLNFFVETFSLGLKNIRLHKLRSLLTTLGIIFGVAAVIIMVAIGEGSKRAAQEQVRQLGAQNILLRSIQPPEGNQANQRTQQILRYGLTFNDRARLATLPGVDAIVAMRDTQQKVVFGERRASANAIGTEPQVFEVINLPLERGRYFNGVDLDQHLPVCVLGALAAEQLFPFEDPIGQKIQVGGSDSGGPHSLEVIGVLERTGLRPTGGFINREIDLDVYFPLSVARDFFKDSIIKRTAGSRETKYIELTEIWLRARRIDEVESLASVAANWLEIGHAPVKDYEVKAPIEILRSAERLGRMFNAIMGSIASFSLIVGGIGIMNIMLASVTERTKEIGIRRALGAKQRHITLQFLVETTVVSLTGGFIGILLGCLTATALPYVVERITAQPYPTQIASWSIIGSFIVSALIGIGFGLYPAITAAKMNPIEALRHAG